MAPARAWRVQASTAQVPATRTRPVRPTGSAMVAPSTARRSPQTPPAPTVANWLSACRSPHTADVYARTVGQYAAEVRQIVEAGRAHQIDAMWAMRYIERLRLRPGPRGKRLAPSSINVVISALSSWWGWMQRQGLVSDNPWAHRRTTLPDHTAQRLLSRDEVRALIAAAPEGVQRTLVLALYSTGARVSELCQDIVTERRTGRPTGLHWRDIQVRRDGSAVLTITGKRSKTRLVPVAKPIARAIRALSRRQPPDDYVFTSDGLDAPITRKEAWQIVHDAGRRAGIKGRVSPHWLRHSYATHLLQQGTPVNTVQALLGHARLDTTGVYVRIITGMDSTAYVDAL